MRRCLFILLALAPVAGCGPAYRVAQVSGRVMLDGKPLAKASVTFAPMATKENDAPGPTAWGPTDADGRYTLSITPDKSGGVVGKCRVYISGLLPDQMQQQASEERDTGGKRRPSRDPVPEKYNKRTELVFDVPAGGTDQANFELSSH